MVSIVNKSATQNVSVANAHARLDPVNYAIVDLRGQHVSMNHLARCVWCGFLIKFCSSSKKEKCAIDYKLDCISSNYFA